MAWLVHIPGHWGCKGCCILVVHWVRRRCPWRRCFLQSQWKWSFQLVWAGGKYEEKSQRLHRSPVNTTSTYSRESPCTYSAPLAYPKKKERNLKIKLVKRCSQQQTEGVLHTADKITKSKYENHCCSPEPPAKSTGPGSGQSRLFRRSWQRWRMTHCTVGAAAYGYDNTLWQGFWTRRLHKLWTTQTKDAVASNSAGGNCLLIWKHTIKSAFVMHGLESCLVKQVCVGGKRLSRLALYRWSLYKWMQSRLQEKPSSDLLADMNTYCLCQMDRPGGKRANILTVYVAGNWYLVHSKWTNKTLTTT